MSLDSFITQAFKLDFQASLEVAIQQSASLLRPLVTEKPCSGEAVSAADVIGAGDPEEVDGRLRSSQDMRPTISRRWLVMPNMHRASGHIDREDQLRMMQDPSSEFLRTYANGMNRQIDRIILGATKDRKVGDGGILGTVVEGKRPGAAGTTLPAEFVTVHGSAGLTQAKLEAAREKLLSDDNVLDGQMPVMVITPGQQTDLLKIASAGGTNFNLLAVDELRSGMIGSYMGFRFVVSNQVPVNAAGHRLCPIFMPSNIVLGVWQDVNTYVAPDPQAHGTPVWSILMQMTATRKQDSGVHVIECAE